MCTTLTYYLALTPSYVRHQRAQPDVLQLPTPPVNVIGAWTIPREPVCLTFAFDINHLLWASTFFPNGIPNVTAWTSTLMAYLVQKGYDVPSLESLRKPFSKALQYFQLTQQWSNELMHTVVEAYQVNTNLCALPLSSDIVEDLSKDPVAMSYYSKEEDHQPSGKNEAPSPYLCSQCSLCFPSKPERDPNELFDSIQCLDACFQQVRCQGTGSKDPPKRADDLEAEDCLEPGLKVPDSVLNSCERSFLAANENHEKALMSAFADTGLMAMICCHDCVLSMVNITSVGEKQYYAVALLEALSVNSQHGGEQEFFMMLVAICIVAQLR
ncbi:hypothetical protein BS47DRAFT_1302517 [Hydnum rufescens UP504]|uniref:Uncharacterized protein n=1 Tax=Hydnum rufescens UP504 TaxID=1448309 RepID=A0A9P6AMV3_9AGAM|nr:hypothetical protein BS47DRAFT_1302517 [Hydnum rufescens UP504]